MSLTEATDVTGVWGAGKVRTSKHHVKGTDGCVLEMYSALKCAATQYC